MALSNVVTQARYLLKDTVTGAYRWSDTELNYWKAQAYKEIIRRRPDASTNASGGSVACGITDNVTEFWEQAVLDYILWRALSKDAEEGDNSQAQQHLNAFLEAVK